MLCDFIVEAHNILGRDVYNPLIYLIGCKPTKHNPATFIEPFYCHIGSGILISIVLLHH